MRTLVTQLVLANAMPSRGRGLNIDVGAGSPGHVLISEGWALEENGLLELSQPACEALRMEVCLTSPVPFCSTTSSSLDSCSRMEFLLHLEDGS